MSRGTGACALGIILCFLTQGHTTTATRRALGLIGATTLSLALALAASRSSTPLTGAAPMQSATQPTAAFDYAASAAAARRVTAEPRGAQLSKFYDHVTRRVDELKELLRTDSRVSVVIAGENDTPMIGKGLAKDQWRLYLRAYGVTDDQAERVWERFTAHLDAHFNELRRAWPERVSYGRVGGAGADIMSATRVHVWGANAENWNLADGERIPGEGQAAAIHRQRPGSFGIVSTPVAGVPRV